MITLKKLKTTFYLFKLQVFIKYKFSKSGATLPFLEKGKTENYGFWLHLSQRWI
jgi:hypothetical protein